MSTVTRLNRRGETPSSRAETAGPALTQAQRAAVIIALLGDSAAKPIVDKLDDAALARMASSLETVTYLSREDLISVVIDFLTELRKTSGALRGGRSRAREVIQGIVDAGRMRAIFGEEEIAQQAAQAEETGDVWTRLSSRDGKLVAAYLNRLTPNIIALILRRLDASIASNIICHLKDEKLGPTLGQMVEAPKLDPGIDSVIERMLEMEFLNAPTEAGGEGSDESHLEMIGEVLSLIPSDKRDNLVGFLKQRYEAKLPIIQKGLFTVEGLPELLPRNSVPVVFKELDQKVILRLLASFRGPNDGVSDYLLGNISSRMADQYREDLKEIGAVAPSEAETIQREFLTTLMDMRRRGVITITRPVSK
ncbi:MAG: FliG C-terminal domain-containing protein [Hyphomonas sp.]